MKNSFYFLAVFTIFLWLILFLGFNTNNGIHLLLLIAGIMVIIRIGFDSEFSISKIRKYKYFKFDTVKKFLT
ncbi:MAG: hypothetical protein HY951_05370 [Bacteroidia bacterium]|nr:hypothetical protein [Bacteroidia bacterium]